MRFIALTALFASSMAIACPDLAGSYPVCRSTTGQSTIPEEMVITQSTSNGVTSYTVTAIDGLTHEESTETITPDGKEVVTTEGDEVGNVYTSTAVSSCDGNKLFMGLTVNVNGQDVADVKIEIKKVGKELHQTSTGYAGNDEVSDTVICE